MPKFFSCIPTLEPFIDNVEYKATVCTKRRIDNRAKALGKDWDKGKRKAHIQRQHQDDTYELHIPRRLKQVLPVEVALAEFVETQSIEEVEIEEDTQDIFLPIHLRSCTTIDEGITFTID